MPVRRRSHPSAACMRLLGRFMPSVEQLHPLMAFDDDAAAAGDRDRSHVERLACALWGVFSHHRAVLDGTGRHFDLGSWRAAAELIADAANRRYPDLNPPIRYMDCYMGVLLGEEQRVEAQPLYRWIFEQLKRAGCDWLYSYSPEPGSAERRGAMREQSAALSRAYEHHPGHDTFAPLPAVVEAYHAVYGRLPEGWPA